MISPTQAVSRSKTGGRSKAFTLIELIVVVLIMGLVYSMVNLNFMKSSTAIEALGPKNIAGFLRSFHDVPARQFVIYGEHCGQAFFDPPLEDTEVEKLAFSKDIVVYESDAYGIYQEKEYAFFRSGYTEDRVCFKIEKHPNGSVTPLLFKNGRKYYVIDPYFEETREFSTLEAAVSAMQKTATNPSYLGLRRE